MFVNYWFGLNKIQRGGEIKTKNKNFNTNIYEF